MILFKDGNIELIFNNQIGFIVADGVIVVIVTDSPKEAAREYVRAVELEG